MGEEKKTTCFYRNILFPHPQRRTLTFSYDWTTEFTFCQAVGWSSQSHHHKKLRDTHSKKCIRLFLPLQMYLRNTYTFPRYIIVFSLVLCVLCVLFICSPFLLRFHTDSHRCDEESFWRTKFPSFSLGKFSRFVLVVRVVVCSVLMCW